MGTFTTAGLNLLKSLEGLRLTAYPDQAGIWTIGYGHTGPEVVPSTVWTQDHADAALQSDINHFALGVAAYVPATLNDNQFSALVIFAYNIGLAAFAASSADRLTKSGDLGNVPAAMMLWDKIHDPQTHQLVVDPGLVKRRQAEINLWNTAPAST
jgi:lysozyme